jgi:uncharacterized MAPEG superfamily protein
MPIELTLLGWSIVLGLVYVMFAITLATQQRGAKWNASNREGDFKPLTGMAARTSRASQNFLETFVFFVAAVLAVVVAQRTNAATALGVQVYFWARVVYLPVYAIGITYLRTLVWVVSLVGIVMVLSALF